MNKMRRAFWLACRRLIHGDRFSIHGVTVTLPQSVDQEIRYLIARGRKYEEAEAQFVSKYVKPGTSIVELGGSIGIVSTIARAKIGPKARHIIAEAIPSLAEIGLKNASAQAEVGSTEMVVAAVDYSGQETVTFELGHNAHTGKVSENTDGHSINVPTTTLASVAQSIGDDRYTLICDIEGAEFEMVAEEAVAFERIDQIILETHPTAYPRGEKSLAEMLTKLETYGFKILEKQDDVVMLARH